MLNKVSQYFFNKFKENEARIHELNYLFWECTRRCNLYCLHCGSDCQAEARIADMPFQDFLQAILPLKKVYNTDSIMVVITGGEPLLRKDLPECGRKLREHGFRWGIVTNGYAYDENTHNKLLGSGMGAITISLDGLEQSHNWLRNNDKSFRNALNALELISSSERLNYDVVTCVNSRNIDELPAICQMLIEKKVKAWRLFTIAPIGRAKFNNELQLSGLHLKQLMAFIVAARLDKRIDVKFSCESYVGDYEKKVRDSYFFCRAGINIASVLIDGSISACPNISRHFVQGNIYKDQFWDVWNNQFKIMRNRSWTKRGICKSCQDYNNCKGGAMHLWDEDQESNSACIYHRISNS